MAFQKKVRRILVIKSRAIGDTILLTGVLRALKKHRPDHQLHVLVRSPAGELLEGLPFVDRVISAKEPTGRIERLAYWMRMLRRLREKRYELVLNFHASIRTSLVAKFLRVEKVVTNHHELDGRNWFSDLPVPGRGQVKSIIDRDLDVLRAIGIFVDVKEALPQVCLTKVEKQEVRDRFTHSKPGVKKVFLGVGGSRETKRWLPEHYIELMEKLSIQDQHLEFVLATLDSDSKWLASFDEALKMKPALKSKVHRFHGLRLRQVAAIVSECALYIGNDSGLKHLAVALGLPTFTFFGPESPLEWHPYDLNQHPYFFIDGLACRTESGKHWCSISTCRKHEHKCMRDIQPDAVVAHATALLQKTH